MGKFDALFDDAPAAPAPSKFAALFDDAPAAPEAKIGLSGPGSKDGTEPQIEAPNLDLSRRPHVKNADGSISTVRSMGFEEDGKQVLVPTVSDDGRIMSDDEAIAAYRKSGKHLGKYDTIAQANAAAQAIHEGEAAKLDGAGPKVGVGEAISRGASRVAGFGFGPAIEAGIDTGLAKLRGTPATYGDTLRAVQARNAAATAQHPLASQLAEGTATAATALLPIGAGAEAATVGGRIAAGAASGAAQGGVQGAADYVSDPDRGGVSDALRRVAGGAEYGAALGGAVPAAGATVKALAGTKAVAALIGKATDREIDRAATAYGVGAAKKARAKLQGDLLDEDPGAEFRRVLADEPELRAAASAPDPVRAKAAEDVAKRGGAQLQSIYAHADATRGPASKVPVASDLTKAAEDAEDRWRALIDERTSLPATSVAREKIEKAIVATKAEADGLRRQAAAKITATRTPGIRAWDALPGWDSRIAELASGTESEIATANRLRDLRDSFKARFGEHETVPAAELRRWQTDYQNAGYGKANPGDTAGTATIAANREASKIVGDPIVQHVTGMSYAEAAKAAEKDPTSIAGRLFAANEKVAVANNVLTAVKSRVGNNPNAPHRLTALTHSAELGGHVAGAAVSHGTSLLASVPFAALKYRHAIAAGIDKTTLAAGRGVSALGDLGGTTLPVTGQTLGGALTQARRNSGVSSALRTMAGDDHGN